VTVAFDDKMSQSGGCRQAVVKNNLLLQRRVFIQIRVCPDLKDAIADEPPEACSDYVYKQGKKCN
jgi:hypothetical protein